MSIGQRSLRVLQVGFGVALVLASVATPVYAAVPEMNPTDVGSAITLLAGGCLVLSARFRSRK